MYHFLIARLTHHRTLQFSVLFRNVFSSSFSVGNHHKGDTFTVSNLVNSCELSPETAPKLLNRLKPKNPNTPNAVIQLLRNYGFSDSQLCIYVKKHPFVLLCKIEKTLLPKLDFLRSIGVSNTDLPKILIRNTHFLTSSLEKSIMPRYEVIRSFVRNDKEVVSALKRGTWGTHNAWIVNDAVQNIEVLRKLGVLQSSISLLVSNFPNVAFARHSRFVKAVNSVKEMGFDPLMSYFVLAVEVIAKMNKENWESKIKIFARWGWSRDMCLLAFQKQPHCMMLSEKKIMKTMNFLMNDVGLPPQDIVGSPAVLYRNLEKTLIPRCTVIKILKSTGLIKSGLRISTFICITEKTFLGRYVNPFRKDLPLLLDAYKGQNSD